MKYVLDTNTLSFAMAGEPSVSKRLVAEARTDILLPQPVIAEIAYGLARLPSSRRRTRLEERFQVLADEMIKVIWTDEVSSVFGEVKAGLERQRTPLEDFDVAIAAHALAYQATLVTDNLGHMSRVDGLELENWMVRGQAGGGTSAS